MTKQQVHSSVKETLKLLNEVYIYPDKAKKVSNTISGYLADGKYDDIKDKFEFSRKLSNDLQQISGDGHLGLQVARSASQKPTHILRPTIGKQKNNYAFERVEVLDGNIGYLKFNKFNHLDEAQNVASLALQFLQSTDALIIDLRENIGGSPKLLTYMLSHFFNEETLLWEILDRNNEVVRSANTRPELSNKRFSSDFPIYILTSKETYSAAEYFAYTLKHFGKATIIGNHSGGGAHMVMSNKINDLFHGRFSQARPVNPITQSDWEGVGVKPDVKTPQNKALETAYIDALENLTVKYPEDKYTYQWRADSLKAKTTDVTIPVKKLESYVGLYGERELSIINGELYYQLKGREKYKLKALSEDLFMLPNLDYYRVKIIEENGKAVALMGLCDDGRSTKYTKTS